jgi:TolB-like protein
MPCVRGAVLWLTVVACAVPAWGAAAKTTKKPAVTKKAKPPTKKKRKTPEAPAVANPDAESPEAVPSVDPPTFIPDGDAEPQSAPAAAPARAPTLDPEMVTPMPTERPPELNPIRPMRDKPTIAVLDIDVAVPSEHLDAATFTDQILSSFDRTDMFIAIGTKHRDTYVGLEHQPVVLNCTERESSCTNALGKATGTDYVLTARVEKPGSRYLVTVRMIDANKAKVIAHASAQADEPEQLREAVWRATQEALEGYGNSLPAADAARWAARPREQPPASVVTSSGPVSQFGAWALLVGGYQPLSVTGKRVSAGGDVSLNFRRGRFDVAAGAVIAASPGARVALGLAVVDATFRLDLLLRGTAFPAVGWYGGGLAVQLEWVLTPHFGMVANVAGEAYPGQGSFIVALLGAFGLAARF